MIKLAGIAIVLAATGLAVATHAGPGPARNDEGRWRDCSVPVAVAPGHLPRAMLVVENRRGEPVRVRLEGRRGSGLAPVELGVVNAGAEIRFPNVLPAGRNLLTAAAGERAEARNHIDVVNRGSETCARRYLWRVD